MKHTDYIIVGDGFAALFFAHQLIKHRKSFLIYSAGEKGASAVSAGIINPVVLKKFTPFWLASEQIEALETTVDEIARYTGRNYLVHENIHRIFHDEGEKELWLKKADTPELKPYLNIEFKNLETLINPYGVGTVAGSARLNVRDFFNDFKNYFSANGHLIEEKFDYAQLRKDVYKDISFKNIVFCEGMSVKANPFFAEIPVIPNKGHHLKVRLSQPLAHQFTIKKKHFLFPLTDGLYYYGGTYDPNERPDEVDAHAVQQLFEGLSEFYPHDFEVAEINYGLRPTVKDRRPILGSHAGFGNYYVFNGLGARGILNGCYFSQILFNHIEHGEPLMPEVDLKRFG